MKSAPSGQPSSSMVTTHSLPPVQIPPHMPVSSPVARMPHHGIHHHISIAPVNGKLAPVHSATTASSMGSPTSSTGGNGTPTNGDNNNNNNNKRPLMTTKDGKQLSEKKLRRLEKNRLSARECRRRKRQATEDLERQINVLEGENLRLRLQLSIGEEAEENLGKEQEEVTEEIEGLLKSGASEGEIYATIEEFKEKFADYGRDRRSAIEFHVQNVERLLQPTQTTSVAMRALHGGGPNFNLSSGGGAGIPAVGGTSEITTAGATTGATSTTELSAAISGTAAATTPAGVPPVNSSLPAVPSAALPSATTPSTADSNGAPSGTALLEPKKLFTHLVNYLQVTPQQAADLKDSRWVARDLDQSLATSLAVVQELRGRLTQIGDGMETEFNNVRSILTPTQAAKFLVWVADNRACMHMLNELWSRVYPDPDKEAVVEEGKLSPTSP